LVTGILHIITGLNDGGAEGALFRLCSADEAALHHVVSLSDSGKYGPLLEIRGIGVTCLGMPRGRLTLSGLWQLWCLIRNLRPDAIQTWMYHADLLGGVIARLAGQSNVSWGIRQSDIAGTGTARSTILVAKLCARLSRLVPRTIICCAKKAADVHATFGYDAGRMRVIPNGYDLSVFKPNPAAGVELRAGLGIDPYNPVIGFVARFDPLKGHDNLLQALSLLKARGHTPACLLVGTGMEPNNTALAAMVADLGLKDQVYLLGRRNDIPTVMNALDLHVMSSYSEAFPNVLAEAMACGTPCVSTDVGDAAEILGETGWILPPCDTEALAVAMAQALDMHGSADWTTRQDACRAHICANFSIDKMVKFYHSAWFS
jgi:glycosyltransferase involved in cell wall biosynthesis